jgi:hypothetical protein
VCGLLKVAGQFLEAVGRDGGEQSRAVPEKYVGAACDTSAASFGSAFSTASFLSVGSFGSALSVESVFPIGSAGSVLSLGGVGQVGAVFGVPVLPLLAALLS